MGARSWSLLFWLTLSAFCKANVIARSASVELVYQYEGAVWIENLAVRPDGWILPATATSAVLTQLNPVNGEQQVLHDWSKEGNAIMSITDVQPDVFLANTMYCDLSILAVRSSHPMLLMFHRMVGRCCLPRCVRPGFRKLII